MKFLELAANDVIWSFAYYKDLRRTMTGRSIFAVRTPSVLSGDEYRGFWVVIRHGDVEIGREGETLPYFYWKDPEPLHVHYYAFSSWSNTLAKWIHKCPLQGLTKKKKTPVIRHGRWPVDRNEFIVCRWRQSFSGRHVIRRRERQPERRGQVPQQPHPRLQQRHAAVHRPEDALLRGHFHVNDPFRLGRPLQIFNSI